MCLPAAAQLLGLLRRAAGSGGPDWQLACVGYDKPSVHPHPP